MFRLSSDDWRALAEIARVAVSSAVIERAVPDLILPSGVLSERRGAFVSLYFAGKLRGCVGQVDRPGPLADVVARSAISAAIHDSRFAPIQPEEVPGLELEISVLSAPALIRAEDIRVGEHGLLIARDSFRGLLLPQVASERHWTAERFLEETCEKAGLPRDAWRDPSTSIFAFTAEIYRDPPAPER